GWYFASQHSPYVTAAGTAEWDSWVLWPLFAGLALLGAGFLKDLRWRRLTMAGWLLFAAYWGLTAQDLYYKEGRDIVNMVFAVLGVFFFSYLAYHDWLSLKRGVPNAALRFLSISTFVAAGSYFVIDKVQPLRLALIHMVSDHTKWGLDLFGQGDKRGLVYVVDHADKESPTTFFYPDTYCSPYRSDGVGEYCREAGLHVRTTAGPPESLWEQMLLYTPGGGDLEIVPVSIILACTAIQSIMLFVGLFLGTTASWQRKLRMSLIVAAVVYVLNLLRNVGIIWFYGQGDASFWVMHNAIGKGGSLLAMVGIAFVVFRFFPEFFQALVSVLDLPERDGPLERALRLGRRRPDPAPAPAATTA
ncbi:MAG TPA: archaeosortase A, partial [Candidatus Thermoplasmatota archaeon]|nr:archaeosortase A [Candidatus Thermoplasmatota archaeon]